MNKIGSKFLLNGNKFMPEFHLKQAGFTWSTCGPFTKHHERIQKFRETSNLKHLNQNELDKASFAQSEVYSDSKDLAKRTISDKILEDRPYKIARNLKYGYARALPSIVYKFFEKKKGVGVSVNEQLAEELNKPVIDKLKRSLCKIERPYLGGKFSWNNTGSRNLE